MGTPYCDADLEGLMIRRISDRINLKRLVDDVCHVDIVIAGGSLLADEPNDYDIYAAHDNHPLDLASVEIGIEQLKWKKVGISANGLTCKTDDGKIVQFCRYAKSDPDELIKTFDFAHCQVGVSVSDEIFGERYQFHCTKEFVRAMVLQRTFFVCSEYPTSSLMRLVKYARRGLYGDGRGYMPDMIRILSKIIERGFSGFDDYKDQFDAIDLGYEGSEINEFWKIVEQSLIRPNKRKSVGMTDSDFPF